MRERLLPGEQVQEPRVERPGQVTVFVPVLRESNRVMGPVRRHADRVEIKLRTGNSIEGEGPPVSDQDQRQRDPLNSSRLKGQHEQEGVAEANLAECILKSVIGLRAIERPEKDTQEYQ